MANTSIYPFTHIYKNNDFNYDINTLRVYFKNILIVSYNVNFISNIKNRDSFVNLYKDNYCFKDNNCFWFSIKNKLSYTFLYKICSFF